MSFVLEVQIRIKPENVERFMAAIGENARAAQSEPGCVSFDICVDPQDSTKVMLYEVYRDEKAFQAHQEGAAFKKYLAEGVPLLASRERRIWKRVS